MSASLDGYIAARGDEIGGSVPSAELHQWFNDRAREIGVSLYGRKLWEVMSAHWPTADQQPDATPVEVEFARIWQKTPKVVFSTTLHEVSGDARLVTGDAVAEITRLKAQDGAPMEIGGPGGRAQRAPCTARGGDHGGPRRSRPGTERCCPWSAVASGWLAQEPRAPTAGSGWRPASPP